MLPEIKEIKAIQEIKSTNIETHPPEREISSAIENQKNLSEDEIEKTINQINDFIRIFNTKISFEIDKDTKKIVLKIVDIESNEIIRQIPPEELLRVAKRITELLGLIINEKI